MVHRAALLWTISFLWVCSLVWESHTAEADSSWGLVCHFSDFRRLGLNIVPDKSSDLFALMRVPVKVPGDINSQVPGTAYNLQDLTMEYVLCNKWDPG